MFMQQVKIVYHWIMRKVIYNLKTKDLGINQRGINVKYRYKIDHQWGIISSFTYTHQENSLKFYHAKFTDIAMIYSSLSFGPSYCFNKNIIIYGLICAARKRIEVKSPLISAFGDTETELVYGVGLQVNSLKKI